MQVVKCEQITKNRYWMKGEMFHGSDFQNGASNGLNSEVQKHLYVVMFSLNLSSKFKARQTIVGVLSVSGKNV